MLDQSLNFLLDKGDNSLAQSRARVVGKLAIPTSALSDDKKALTQAIGSWEI